MSIPTMIWLHATPGNHNNVYQSAQHCFDSNAALGSQVQTFQAPPSKNIQKADFNAHPHTPEGRSKSSEADKIQTTVCSPRMLATRPISKLTTKATNYGFSHPTADRTSPQKHATKPPDWAGKRHRYPYTSWNMPRHSLTGLANVTVTHTPAGTCHDTS